MSKKMVFARRFCGLWIVVILSSDAISRGDTVAELAQAVRNATRQNYEKLGAVSMTIQQTRLPSAEAANSPNEIARPLPDGGTITFQVIRTNTNNKVSLLAGSDFFEYTLLQPDGQLDRVWQRQGDLWSEFVPSKSQVVVRRTDQLPAIEPIDPRDLAATCLGESVEELLNPTQVKQAKRINDPAFGSESIEIEIETPQGHQPLVMVFAANAGFLPVRARLLTPSGELVRETQVDYQPSGRADTLILKAANITYGVPKSVVSAEDRALLGGSRVLTVDNFELLDDSGIAQRKRAPELHWVISDLSKSVPTQRRVGDEDVIPSTPTWGRFLLLANVLVVIVLLAVWSFRRFKLIRVT